MLSLLPTINELYKSKQDRKCSFIRLYKSDNDYIPVITYNLVNKNGEVAKCIESFNSLQVEGIGYGSIISFSLDYSEGLTLTPIAIRTTNFIYDVGNDIIYPQETTPPNLNKLKEITDVITNDIVKCFDYLKKDIFKFYTFMGLFNGETARVVNLNARILEYKNNLV